MYYATYLHLLLFPLFKHFREIRNSRAFYDSGGFESPVEYIRPVTSTFQRRGIWKRDKHYKEKCRSN